MKKSAPKKDPFDLVGAKLRWHLISAALLLYPEGGLSFAAEVAAQLYKALRAEKGKLRGKNFF